MGIYEPGARVKRAVSYALLVIPIGVTHLGRQIPVEKSQVLGGKFKIPTGEFQKPAGEFKILVGDSPPVWVKRELGVWAGAPRQSLSGTGMCHIKDVGNHQAGFFCVERGMNQPLRIGIIGAGIMGGLPVRSADVMVGHT